ncbi:MAG: hypothetical protein KDD51_12800 [Bdellovibrionales bacterium]|nr:hypothetical protein [Bdellovibrionales bacterium]
MRRLLVILSCLLISSVGLSVGTGHGPYSYSNSRPKTEDAAIQSLLSQASACGLDRNFAAPLLKQGSLGAVPPVSVLPPSPPAIPNPPVVAPPVLPPVAPPVLTPLATPEKQPEPIRGEVARGPEKVEPSKPSTPSSSQGSRDEVKASDSAPEKNVAADEDRPVPSVSKPTDHPEAQAHWISANSFARRAVWAFPTPGRPGYYDFWDDRTHSWRCT